MVFLVYVCVYTYAVPMTVMNVIHRKSQEPPNIGKLGTTRIMMASVRYVASGSRIRKLQAFLFLLN